MQRVVRAAHRVAGNTINVNAETGVVEMDCKGLTLGRFYYVPARPCSTSLRVARNFFVQVRISSSNVLGFGPARVLFPSPHRAQLMSALSPPPQTFSFNSTGSSGFYTSVRAR